MTRTKLGGIIALNLLFILLALAAYRHAAALSLTCQGNLTFSEQRDAHNFSFEGAITMRFHPDGRGYFTLNGDVQSAGHSWLVSRQETFRWRKMHDALYEVAILTVERFGHDRLPDEVFEKYVAGLAAGQKRLLTLEHTPEDALAIGNAWSPLLLCAE